MAIAAFNHTGALLAGVMTLVTLAGPTLAYWTFSSPRAVSVTFGFTAMCMGGLLVHFGQGVMQIEMHFAELKRPGDGRLVLATRVVDGSFVVELHDNGRGIDWDSVARRAAELGLPHKTPAERVEALFHDGLSTRAKASELSGRDVGMGALRSACRALGGTVEVDSEPGRGTALRFVFPRSATGAAPAEVAAAS